MIFPPEKNRRRSQRRWVSVPVVVRQAGLRIDGFSINVGAGGMYLFAAAAFEVGTEIEVEFRLQDYKDLIREFGTVRRRAVYVYGIEFLPEAAAAGRGATTSTDNSTVP